jgi:nitrite reductase (cytochrome c-552)
MSDTESSRPGLRRLALVAGLFALLAIGVGALLTNISGRQAEGRTTWFRVVEITDTLTDPAVWGQNFPLHYDQYRRTTDMVRTRFGGSEAMPRTPTDADPRSIVAQSRLEEDPRLRRIWQGFPFAVDFREERGHAFMLEDQTYTGRQLAVQQPGACAHCHASVYVPYMRLGEGDLIRGFERMNPMPFQEARPLLEHPVACIDCHDPGTMALRITRPAFMEGMRALKAAEGVADYDVTSMATRQEMRSFVCAQCHVEYYFSGPERRLVYPWHRGLLADSMLAYYEAIGFADWTHAATGARVLKAQHPEFELWAQGSHARAGVTCADCHMPYQRVGAMKISNHHVRSPLLNISNACQTCHKVSEPELLARAELIQTRTFQLRNTAMDAVVELIDALEAAVRRDSTHPGIAEARRHQRRAQFLVDYIEAENSMGFHAPQEAARVLGNAINEARKGQVALPR